MRLNFHALAGRSGGMGNRRASSLERWRDRRRRFLHILASSCDLSEIRSRNSGERKVFWDLVYLSHPRERKNHRQAQENKIKKWAYKEQRKSRLDWYYNWHILRLVIARSTFIISSAPFFSRHCVLRRFSLIRHFGISAFRHRSRTATSPRQRFAIGDICSLPLVRATLFSHARSFFRSHRVLCRGLTEQRRNGETTRSVKYLNFIFIRLRRRSVGFPVATYKILLKNVCSKIEAESEQKNWKLCKRDEKN